MWVSKPAAIAFGAYLVLSAVGDGYLPLFHLTMFGFSVPQHATVVPYFKVAGEIAQVTDYTAFDGITAQDVDVGHEGYECSVEHLLLEHQQWIGQHQLGGAPGVDRVAVEIGFHVLDLDAERRVRVVDLPKASGTAQRRP